MEIENISSAYKADVVNIDVPYKNIQGNNLLNNESESPAEFFDLVSPLFQKSGGNGLI
ncbi:hypothetical protein [Sphingobacterium sp. UBA7631]|uniref:hypothetical protein n=1 Tax=Sphingobacterium sp. UBA7631 TaxID=1947523 RepID=UPI00257DED77|nr:hypothetical protein [Sphingobacterium sp. UBA7631]